MRFPVFLKNSRYMQYFSVLTATLSVTSGTIYVTWASPSLPRLTSNSSPIGTTITPAEASWVASSFLLGVIPGSIVAGLAVEKFGRRGSMVLSTIPLFLPWILVLFAKSALDLIIARFVAGMGSAIAMTAAPMYSGEIAEKDIRGKLSLLCNLFVHIASFLVLALGPFVSYTALTLICSVFPLSFLILFCFIPESPYFLVKTGRTDSARNNLIRLSSNTTDQKTIDDRLKLIESVIERDMKRKSTLWEFVSKPEYRKSLIVMTGIKILQQCSGLVAIASYMQTIVGSSNSSISPETSSIIFGAINLIPGTISVVLVDKLGRKPLLIMSALGCALALTGEGIYFYLQDAVQADVSSISWLPTTGVALFLLMNHTGVYSVPFVLLGELFATNIKGIAVAVFMIYNAVLSFLVVKLYEPITDAWGMYTMFWIFAGICVLGSLFVLFALPETKGKTFTEIQEKFNRTRNVQLNT